MGDPPPPPQGPPPTSNGTTPITGNSGNEQLSKHILDCGGTVNYTSLGSMSPSEKLIYLNQIYTALNCSNNNGTSAGNPSSPSNDPHVVLVAYFALIMALGLSVNVCVIGTICRVKKLRTITNCFVLSLAFADLLMATVVIPLKINLLYNPTESIFLDTLFPILGVASLLNLCAVTLDRYFTITNPLTYEVKVSSLQAGIAIACIWIISTAQEMVTFALRIEDAVHFQVIRFVIVFSFPFICIVFVNTKIYFIARGHARQIRATQPGQNDSNRKNFSKKMKSAQIIGLLVGTFILTWLPYFIITIYEENQMQRNNPSTNAFEISKTLFAALACSTALFNPLLYGFLRKEVRIAIVKCLKCQNLNQPEFDKSGITATRKQNLESTRN